MQSAVFLLEKGKQYLGYFNWASFQRRPFSVYHINIVITYINLTFRIKCLTSQLLCRGFKTYPFPQNLAEDSIKIEIVLKSEPLRATYQSIYITASPHKPFMKSTIPMSVLTSNNNSFIKRIFIRYKVDTQIVHFEY